jgi:hypothetical protein
MATANLRKGLTALAGTAMAVLFVGGLLFLVLSIDTGGDGAPQAVATTQPGNEATETPGTPLDVGSAESGRTEAADGGLLPDHQPDMVPLPPMGIATTAFEWTVGDLLGSAEGEVWLNQLLLADGTLWAIGGGYDPSADSEYTVVFTSNDGVTWQRRELPEGLSSSGSATFTATDSGMAATVNAWDEETGRAQLRVFVSADGDGWAESDLSSFVGADENLWVSWLAGGDGLLLMAGAKENVPARDWGPSVITIDRDSYIIELDERDWTYTISDAATGTVVISGSQETIWSSEGENTGIYDSVVGDIIFPLSWETLDQAGVAAYEGAQWGAPLVVTLTSGDRTLTLDEFRGELSVTDASGAVIFTGTEEDLWQGPPPTFTDPATGDVIVVVPWDEWNAAHEAAHPEPPVGAYSATPVLLRSADGGTTWAPVDIEAVAGPGFMFQSLQFGPNGFLAVGAIDDYAFEATLSSVAPSGPPAPLVLTSPDGLAWTELSTNLEDGAWLHGVSATDDGYVAILSGDSGSRVAASSDGATWRTVLSQDDLGLELGNVWFDRIAAGAMGTFVTGTYDGYSEPEAPAPATISKEGRTLTIDMLNYTVTDDATGAVLFTFDESVYWSEEEASAGTPFSGFKWGQGGIVMFDDAGGVVFAASHREFEEAMQDVWAEPSVYYEAEPVLLFSDGGDWVRVPLAEDIGPQAWIGGMAVTDTSVALTATSEAQSGLEFSVSTKALVGVPAG